MAKKYVPYSPLRPDGSNKQKFVEALQSKEDYLKMLKFLHSKTDKKYFLMFVFGTSFALRITDIVNLTWDYVLTPDYQIKDIMWVQESKRKRVKEIPINSFVNWAIVEYMQSLGKKGKSFTLNDIIFPSNKGGGPIKITSMCTKFKELFAQAGVDDSYNYCTHTMRKSAGKELYDKGYDVWEICKLLGHKSIQETLCYIGITKKKINEMYTGMHDDVLDAMGIEWD